jgi:exonuclease III
LSITPKEKRNIRSNETDNDSKGDNLQHKDPDTFRPEFGNENGINLAQQGAQFKELCEDQKLIQADYRGIAESCLDTDKDEVRQTLHSVAKTSFACYSLELSSSPATAVHQYKPEGVIAITQDSTVGRIRGKGQDEMGRWTFTKFMGRAAKVITIISAYQVCNNNCSGTTAYHQQQSALIQRGTSNQKPRKHFQNDLHQFLGTSQSNGESIIFVGNLNENLDIGTSSTAHLCESHGLVDIFAARHPDIEEFCTYIRGTKRIDYYLISQDILPSVTAVGYAPFHYRSTSDHQGLFLDLDVTKLFGNATVALAAQLYRAIHSKDMKSDTKYIEAMTAHLTKNNFYTNMTLLQLAHNDNLAERLDDLLGQACLHAEKQCKPRVNLWWSRKLTHTRLYQNFLYRALCGFRNNLDLQPTIQARMMSLDVTFNVPSTKEECSTAFKESKLELKKLMKQHLKLRLEELDECAELHALARDKDKAKIVKEIKNQESIAATFRKIRSVTRPAQSRGFTSIDVLTSWPKPSDDTTQTTSLPDPKKATSWRTADLPQDVLHYLLLRNRLHFGQAEGTPFTLPPFSIKLNWEASTATAELFLEGEYTNDKLSDIQELLVAHCARLSPLDDIPAEITVNEFEAHFHTWDERTTTSPSGIHLGHYKALLQPNNADPSTDEGRQILSARDSII